jgi:hypothetical protein
VESSKELERGNSYMPHGHGLKLNQNVSKIYQTVRSKSYISKCNLESRVLGKSQMINTKIAAAGDDRETFNTLFAFAGHIAAAGGSGGGQMPLSAIL